MKTLLLAGAALMVATTATASPLDDFRNDGKIGGWLDLDFAMQNELNSAIQATEYELNKKAEAGTAGAGALAMLPEGDGVLAMGVAKHGSGKALALGYSKNFGANKEYLTRVGLSRNSESDTTIAAGLGYKF